MRSLYVRASLVDHIEPHRDDQLLFWDRDNFQSLCASCHSLKSKYESFAVRRDPVKGRTIVCGPPGSGKTTWLQSHKEGIDHTFDMDELAGMAFPLPHEIHMRMLVARGKVLNRMYFTNESAIIIITDERHARRAAASIGADVVRLRDRRDGAGPALLTVR